MKFRGLDIDPSKINESITVKPKVLLDSANAFKESTKEGRKFLLPKIEAIHEGTTRNYTRYLGEKLKGDPTLRSGVYSWTHPYPKPVIYNHDVETEVTGRVHSAYFAPMTSAGRPGIIVVPKITEDKAVQGVLDGRLMTVSIGATTNKAVCSYCGTDILEEGFCGHYKGETTEDGKVVEWIVGDLWFDELSWVNVPADQDAMVIDSGEVSIAEAYAVKGNEIINLGKESTVWAVNKKLAQSEGLLETDEKGEITLTLEELQALVAELEEKNTELTTQVEEASKMIQAKEQEILEKSTELDAKTAELAEKQTELEAKTTELTEATTKLAEKETEVAELSTTKEAEEVKTKELTSTVEALEAEKTVLLEQNQSLSGDIHKGIVERVVDLKLSLGKESNREEALEKHLTRSTESLKDSLGDLITEASTATTRRVVESVTNPAGSAINDGKELNTTTEGMTKTKELTVEDALKGLFNGPGYKRS